MATRKLNCFLGLCLCVAMMLTMIMPGLAFAELDETAPEDYVEESSDVPALAEEEEIPAEEPAETVLEDDPEVEEPAEEPEVQEPEDEPEVQEPTESREEQSEEQVIESGNPEEESTERQEDTVAEEATTIELANTEVLGAVVEETEPEPGPDEVHYGEVEFAGIFSAEETEDPETILNAYAQMRLDSLRPRSGGMLRAPQNPTYGFSEGMAYAFNALRNRIGEIAAQGGSTIMEVNFPADQRPAWTPTQIQQFNNNFTDTSFTETNYKTAVGIGYEHDFPVQSLLQALLNTCVYELYWFDKTVGIAAGYSYSWSANKVSIVSMRYYLAVVDEYAGAATYNAGDTVMKVEVRSDVGTTIQSALDEINSVVSAAPDSSCYDTLTYFKDRICELVDYNHPAADDDSTPYGNPWQLIWVFDRDPDTKVVCEGYAKAFAYLCDLKFPGDNPPIRCYTVSGSLSAGTGAGGGHLWDVVKMDDGLNYLVDVTNCDNGSIGYPDLLFLKGYSQKINGGYSYLCHGTQVAYTYKSDTTDYYPPKDLEMCPWAYGERVVLSLNAVDENGSAVSPNLTGAGEYGYGDEITVSAGALTNYQFMGWYDVGGTLISDEMESPISCFTTPGEYQLTAKYKNVGTIEYYTSLTLKDDVSINYYVVVQNIAASANLNDYVATYTYDGQTNQQPLTTLGENKIVVAHSAAKNMGDSVHFELLYQGQPIYSNDYSVRDYCESQIENSAAGESLKNLCRTILDYGASSQQYFGYDQDHLINQNYSNGNVEAVQIPESCNRFSKTGSLSSVKSIYYSLLLKSKTAVNIYFEPAEGASLDDLSFQVDGINVASDSSGRTEIKETDDGMVCLTIKNFAAKNLNDPVSITAADGTESMSLTYSPLTYAYLQQSNGNGLGTVCKALYQYYLAAAQYFI